MSKSPECPPWIYDTNPERWVLVSLAARFFFRRTPLQVKRWIKSGALKARGIDSYWDGARWYVRLPSSAIARKVQLARSDRRLG